MPTKKSYWKHFGPQALEVKHNGFIYYSWMDDHVTFHQPTNFTTLTHVTSLENTKDILQEGLKMQVINSYSSVNRLKDSRGCKHPLEGTPFLWMAPDNHETTTAIRYGNVAFSLKNLLKLHDLKFYYVEFLDYLTKTGVRVMLTTKNYDHVFNRFDPLDETLVGNVPVLYKDDEWIRFTSFSNERNDEILLDVEFLLDVIPVQNTLYCKYVKCYDPRPIVTPYGKTRGSISVYNGNLDIFRLICLLARYQGKNMYELRSVEFLTEIIVALQSVVCTDDFISDESINDLPNRRSGENFKVDYVLCEIDFGKAFDLKEIRSKDWLNVQILDFIFHDSKMSPNIQTILNVLTQGIVNMKSLKTISEIFSIFFQCFLSASAKKHVKRGLVNILCSL